MERRFAPGRVQLETRVGTDYPYAIVGHAAVFYSEADPGTEFELWEEDGMRCVERIMATAFDGVLQTLVPQVANGMGGVDVAALYNHNPDHLLGRVSAGTLKLTKDARGLHYGITPPDAPLTQGLIASIKRGDLNGSSFSFTVGKKGQRWIRQGNLTVREIHSVSGLMDVGPVVFPAYQATSASMGTRAAEDAQEAKVAYRQWLRAEERVRTVLAQAEARARCVELGL